MGSRAGHEDGEIDRFDASNATGSASADVPYPGWSGKHLSREECSKVKEIIASSDQRKVQDLVRLASSSGGLIDDEARRVVWPLLLGYDTSSDDESPSRWQDLPRHKDEDQVELDVHRSFIYYPKNESEKRIDQRKQELSAVITQVLREHPMLSYFQGFHDIAQVFLLVLGADHAVRAVTHLSFLRIRDFMLPTMVPSLAHLQLLPTILESVEPDLKRHLSQTRPFFALSATLTLYAHDIQEYGDISRLFDFLIAQPAVVSVYFFAVIILARRKELFEIPADEPDMLTFVLSKLPKPLDLELWISQTQQLFRDHPPEKLPSRAWSKISPCSVLKTTMDWTRVNPQSVQDGERLFEMQILQLRREELRRRALSNIWTHRRPVGGVGLAIFVGVLAYWFGKRGFDGIPVAGLRKFLIGVYNRGFRV